MLRTIRIYGRLARFLKRRKFVAEIATAAEAVRFLLANFPQLEHHMLDQHYKVLVGGQEIDEKELSNPSSVREEIRIIPVLTGAGAVGRIIAGVALVALASLVTFGTLGGLVGAGVLNSVVFGVGASLALGGVAQLLTPTPTLPKEETDPRKSYSFSGVQNTSRQGIPVPIVYGEMLVGSIVVSAGIDIDDLES